MKHVKYILDIIADEESVTKYTEMFEEAVDEMLARDDCPEVYEVYTKTEIEDAEVE